MSLKVSNVFPVFKQQHKFIFDYLYSVIKQKHFDSILLSNDNFISWLMEHFDHSDSERVLFLDTCWNGLIIIPLKYINNDIKYYLEQLWFRSALNHQINTYYLIPSICIFDIIDSIKKRKNELIYNNNNNNGQEPVTKRRKLNNGHVDLQKANEEPLMSIPDPPNFNFDEEHCSQIVANEMNNNLNLNQLKQIAAKCICNNILNPMTTQNAAFLMDVQEFLCDKCNKSLIVSNDTFIFHCPSNNAKEHKDTIGYDLCVNCAKSTAVITISVPQNTKHINNININTNRNRNNMNTMPLMPMPTLIPDNYFSNNNNNNNSNNNNHTYNQYEAHQHQQIRHPKSIFN